MKITVRDLKKLIKEVVEEEMKSEGVLDQITTVLAGKAPAYFDLFSKLTGKGMRLDQPAVQPLLDKVAKLVARNDSNLRTAASYWAEAKSRGQGGYGRGVTGEEVLAYLDKISSGPRTGQAPGLLR